MARWITLLLLCLALGPWTSSNARQKAPASASVLPECTTCQGAGRALLPCELCGGDGKAPCVDCANTQLADLQKRHLAIIRETEPEKARELEDAYRQLADSLEALERVVGRVSAGSQPGKLPCPAGCKSGVSFLNSGHPCKACATKGFVECSACQGKGEARCEACKGKRNRMRPCYECSGHGVAPDPLKRTADAATCPWCEDKRVAACKACDGTQLEQDCSACRGAGDSVCGKCAGTKKTWCNKCSGTGDLSSYFAAKSSNDCNKCDKKGLLDCTECKAGRVACKRCAGKGRLTGGCQHCMATRHTLCVGCTLDSDLAWTTTSGRLAAAGMGAEALAHLDVAIARIEKRSGERLRAFVGTEKERQAFAKERAKDADAVKKQRAQLAKKLGL